MDPLTELIAKGGIGVLVAFIIVKWLASAVERLFTKFDARAELMMTQCAQERDALTKRIQFIEDRQYQAHNDILFACAQALEVNARAFKKLSEIETDKFPIMNPDKETRT